MDILGQVHGGEAPFANYLPEYIISVCTFWCLTCAEMIGLLLSCIVMVGKLGRTVMLCLNLLPVDGGVFVNRWG